MTIKEIIVEKEIISLKDRLNKMKELKAPTVIINNLDEEIKKLSTGSIKITGDIDVLDISYNTHEVKKGRGGKCYIQFNNSINYFPNAKYGRYITIAK